MKTTKFNHSYLLVEEGGKVFLLDPGEYSLDLLKQTIFSQLDYILITHEHFDHFSLPFIKELFIKFPQVKIITTQSIVGILEKEGVRATFGGDKHITVTAIPHEKIWMGNPVENVMFTINNKLSHPGDSLTFDKTAEILCLPISGPWCNTTQAVELAEKLKPKIIIPIHDWHWKDEVRISMQQRLKEYFQQKGIGCKVMGNGKTIEV